MSDAIAILDLGGQYCHLIARRLRDLGVRADIHAPGVAAEELRGCAGVILSGGPQSVYDPASPSVDAGVLELGVPVLGICYGHQLLARLLGADVEAGGGEYGLTLLRVDGDDRLFRGTPETQKVWMSHADSVTRLPAGAVRLAASERCPVAAFADGGRRLYGVQFHPEVVHTDFGAQLLHNFAVLVCGIREAVASRDLVDELLHAIRERVGNASVFFLVSGGVDSTVAFVLCARALGRERVRGLYVDTGLMRKGETQELRDNLETLGLADRLEVADESERFLSALDGVCEPERKRFVIGRLFVEAQSRALERLGVSEDAWLLGQGTIYPDTIESGGSHGRAAVIKTHHNRCAEIRHLIERGRVVEPLSEFYKDEVRQIGVLLELRPELVNRWPFPGPGLAIRCLCRTDAADAARVLRLPARHADYEAAVLPVLSVGVQGDARTYRGVVAARGPLDAEALQTLGAELCNADTAYNRLIVHLAGDAPRLADGVARPAPLARARLAVLREADALARAAMEEAGLADSVWQFPVVLIPVFYAGGESVVLRPVQSRDGMTANWAPVPGPVLRRMAGAIASLDGVGAVFLDATNKPPATIEWE